MLLLVYIGVTNLNEINKNKNGLSKEKKLRLHMSM